jgi:hypothetical protein
VAASGIEANRPLASASSQIFHLIILWARSGFSIIWFSCWANLVWVKMGWAIGMIMDWSDLFHQKAVDSLVQWIIWADLNIFLVLLTINTTRTLGAPLARQTFSYITLSFLFRWSLCRFDCVIYLRNWIKANNGCAAWVFILSLDIKGISILVGALLMV